MGVKGLWTLLTPVGRPVLLETMEGKVLAIDSSIWIYQFQATMRDKEGRALVNGHVLGFLRRISKLLFYGIKPVFVFDGGAPALKRVTISERKSKKRGAAASHARLAEQLLAAQMRKEALGQAAAASKDKETPSSAERPVLDEDTVYLEDYDGPAAPRPTLTPRESKEKQKAEAEESARKKRNRFADFDPYRLPEVDVEATLAARASAAKPDPRLATEEELRTFIDEMRPDDFDVSSPAFRELPTEVQYEIIGDLRLRSRQTSHRRLETMLRNAPTAIDFSRAQIKLLKERNSLTQQLLTTAEGVGKHIDHHLTIPVRIASERNREYVLVKNSGSEGGWVLGITDIGTKDKPIELDSKEQERADEDEYDDMEEDDFPDPSSSAQPDPDLREYMRSQALSALAERYTPKKAAPATARQLQPSSSIGPPRKPGSQPLFAPERPQRPEDSDAVGDVEWEEDEDLARAIHMSWAASDENPASDEEAGPSVEPDNAFLSSSAAAAGVSMSISESEDEDMEPVPLDSPPPSVRDPTASLPIRSISPQPPGAQQATTSTASPPVLSIFGKPQLLTTPIAPAPTVPPASSFGPSSLLTGHSIPASTSKPTVLQPQASFHSPSVSTPGETLDRITSHPLPVSSTPTRPAFRRPSLPVAPPMGPSPSIDRTSGGRPSASSSFSTPSMLANRPGATTTPSVLVRGQRLNQNPPSRPEVVPTPSAKPTRADQRPEIAREISSLARETSTQSLGTPGPSSSQSSSQTRSSPFRTPAAATARTQSSGSLKRTWSADDDEPREAHLSDEEEPFDWSRSPSPSADPSAPRSSQQAEDWDAAQEMDVQAEEGEFARFMSQVKGKDIASMQKEIDEEIRTLNKQKKAAMRDSEDVTQQMITQIQNMLRLFGIPYITAPMEAEAQCAELVALGLVEGVITDDSDVFLFGGLRVFKNMFNQSKTVECFLLSDLGRELSLDRDKLIRLAYLLGSDYVDGLPGVGPVVAMELMKEFPGEDGLHKFKEWWLRVQSGKDKPSDSSSPFRRRFKKRFKDLYLSNDWPNSNVRDAYYHPTVDESTEAFKWGLPDLDALREFLHEELSWSVSKVDETLLPIIRKVGQRGKAAQANKQGTLNSYFDISVGTGAYAPRPRQAYSSKRLQKVVQDFRKEQARTKAGPSTGNDQGSGNDEDDGQPATRTKGKRKAKAPAEERASKKTRPRRGRGGRAVRPSRSMNGSVDDSDGGSNDEPISIDDEAVARSQSSIGQTEGGSGGEASIADVAETAPVVKPKPRPKPRRIAKGKKAAGGDDDDFVLGRGR